jgi:hypothetical protein
VERGVIFFNLSEEAAAVDGAGAGAENKNTEAATRVTGLSPQRRARNVASGKAESTRIDAG